MNDAPKVTGTLFAIFYGIGAAVIVFKGVIREPLSTIEIIGFTSVSVLGLGLLGVVIATGVRRRRSRQRATENEAD